MTIWLVMQASDGRERSFQVAKPRVIIGRETTCDVRVPIPTVSRRHCQIELDGAELKLVDLQSDRGTFHNGNRVQEAVLAPEDTLTIGPVTFRIRVEHDAGSAGGASSEIVIERQPDLLVDSVESEPLQSDRLKDLDAG